MERVQFQQEQMLAELKDLVLKGLFSEVETKQIMKKRTEFEIALVRRIAKKTDYLRYAAYEMDLEKLRRKRAARMKQASSSISNYALVRRQFHIFDRAVRKFKGDVGLWTQYIQVAKKTGARALAGKITARALQLLPNVPSLYILAASHELHSLSTSAARTLLQRGIRLNPDSIQLWTEYVKMELGFIEGLRRRWTVLGLNPGSDVSNGKQREKDVVDETEIEGDDESEKSSGIARQEIMNGVIAKTVMSNAAQALPKVALFKSLEELITGYPMPQTLRESLLVQLYALLREHLPEDAQAIKLLSQRFTPPDTAGNALVEGLKNANEEFIQAIRRSGAREDMCYGYTEFVEEWCKKDMDGNLKLYLLSSLRLIVDEFNEPVPLVPTYIRMMASLSISHPKLAPPEKILQTIRTLACKEKTTSGDVWIARLEAESGIVSREETEKAWSDARSSVAGPGVQAVWLWGVERDVEHETNEDLMEGLLKESMRDSSLRSIHDILLMRYMKGLVDTTLVDDTGRVRRLLQHAVQTHLVKPEIWAAVFEQTRDLEKEMVFEQWKQVDGREATISWATWLIRNGRGEEAKEVIVRERRTICESERENIDERWGRVLDGRAE